MAANEFKPVSFNGEALTTGKLNQVANNVQWLYDRSPRVRYTSEAGVVRDAALKIITGKANFHAVNKDGLMVKVYFGSFFTAGCRPIVTATVETFGSLVRKVCSVRGLGGPGSQIDHTGFIGEVFTVEAGAQNHLIERGGWVHWHALGY